MHLKNPCFKYIKRERTTNFPTINIRDNRHPHLGQFFWRENLGQNEESERHSQNKGEREGDLGRGRFDDPQQSEADNFDECEDVNPQSAHLKSNCPCDVTNTTIGNANLANKPETTMT